MFSDRTDAGERLADAVAKAEPAHPVVLALPRGGVPVALPVARALDAPLDLLLVRKIGMPGQPELAAGALVEGDPPEAVYNAEILRLSGLSEDDFAGQVAEKTEEIAERRRLWLEDRAPVPLEGRTAVVVDDGIATGATVRAALSGLRARGPASVWLAVPVAPVDTLRALRSLADRVICLSTPADFQAVGLHYRRFGQVSDAEVAELMRQDDSEE
ncbi:phosphoribosyltransferase [Rhodosalinus sp. K401]|uniref:phosphoribosyltransferase n=1 Tax=Rhodosalinus sp. K401 TaxID=3239195 RepID=UPI0035240A7A